MLHLVTGWKTHERKGTPEVLYCGLDRSIAQHCASAADPSFHRVEYAEVLMSLKWTKRIVAKIQNSLVIEKSAPSVTPAAGVPEAAPSASERGEGAGDGDGPQLLPAITRSTKPEIKTSPPRR